MSDDLYKQLGLTAEEVRVYSVIVSKLVRTIEEIEILANLAPEAIKGALDELEKKKFVRVIPGKVPQYIALAPAIAVTSEIDRQIENELNQIQEEIKKKWEIGQKELAGMVNDFQMGTELFSTTENEFQSHVQAYMEQLKAKSAENLKEIENQISTQNKENSIKLEDLIKGFSANLEPEVQKNISILESNLQNIKEAQIEERKQHLGKISENYSERINSLNNLISQMKQSVQTLQQQVANNTENLNSNLSTVNEQTNRNIDQNKLTSQDELNSIGEEVTKKITDKLNIINQQIEAVQTNLINSGEESLNSIKGMVQGFSEQTSQSSLSVIDIANRTAENLWNNLQEIMKSFTQTISSLDEAKEKISSKDTIVTINETLTSAKDGLIKGLEELERIQTDAVRFINAEMTTQLSSFQEKMHNDNSTLFEKLESSIRTQYNAGIEKLFELTAEISTILEANGVILTQESSETIEKVIRFLKQLIQALSEKMAESFSEMINNVADSEKTFSEDSELTLVDMSTSIDELNLKIKEIQAERSEKISESMQYLRNVADEEFSSFGASANMMLGQMQSTLIENVAARTEEITQNFNVISQVGEYLSQSSLKIQEEISRTLERLQTSMDAGNQTFSEAFDEDIANLAMDVETVSQKAKKKQDEQLTASNVRLNTFKDNIEKITLELSRGIPTKLEEYQARHTDDFNNFDRQVKAELNKIRARLSEINTQVTERLKKRVSLGKAGFQDIEKIVTTAMKEFEGAQKRTEKLIDDQITNFRNSSENFAETINTSLNTQNLEIQRLMETIGDDLVESVNSSYSLALQNISAFSDKIKERFNVRKDNLTDHLGILLSTISTSLGESLRQGIVNEFNEMDKTLQQLNQTAQAPKELETILGVEVESFIQNLQLAFQSASESGGTRIAEVINESLAVEINTTFDTLKSQSDLSNLKEAIKSHWKSSSLKGSSVLSKVGEDLLNQSNTLLESKEDTLQILTRNQEETQANFKEIVHSKILAMDSAQKEKSQEIPAQLEESSRVLVSNLQETQQEYQNILKTANQTINESIKELSSQITSNTIENLQEIRSIPVTIEETSTQITENIEKQYHRATEVIDNVRSSSLEQLKKMEQETSNEKTQFIDQIEKINVELEKELSNLKSMVTELDNNFHEKKTHIEEEIQHSINTFSDNVQSIFVKLETELSSGKIQLSQKMDRLYQDFQTRLEDFSTTAQNFVTSLNTRHTTILDQANSFLDDSATNNINTLELEKKTIIDRQQMLFTEVDQNLTSFSTTFGQLITDSLEDISKDIQENITGIKNTVTEVGTSYYDTIDTMLAETYSFFESERGKMSKVLEHDVSNLISEVDKKATQAQDTISSDLSQIIGSIPKKLAQGLTKSKDLMSAMSEVQKMAFEIPISNMEETYLQTQAETSVIQTLEAMLSRTKSTIQIMVPKLSMIPWDLLKKAGTRRRIQILTNVDSQETANKIAQELGNVQLKHYDKVEVFAFARDGQEEAAVGTGDSSGVQLIVTTDGRLVGVLKEIIQDIWPRGKAV